ncbi:MAG TPA: phosphate signaling complex protein PhoU [Firmicutes bacterium]|nr:phosphate signaling complex protein PhoU [Bacillota bacterium]
MNLHQPEQLRTDFIRMGKGVEAALKNAVKALVEKDTEEALKVLANDSVIDNDLIVIEEKVAAILADRNPKGRELRTCLSIAKLARDLERIGDYASNIAEITLELKNEEYIKALHHISRLAEVACEMLGVAIKAFDDANPDLAEAVCRKDEEADNFYEELYGELLQILTKSGDLRRTGQAVRFLLAGRFLERIADHATNIGEETIFVYTGKRVKY